MKQFLWLLVLPSLFGCSYFAANTNREAIQKGLYDGMTKTQVFSVLGEPFKLDHPEPDIELLYYETNPFAATFCLQYTPIRLVAGKVAQWGHSFCNEPASAIPNPVPTMDKHLQQ